MLAEAGVPVSNMFFVEVLMNSSFLGLFSFVEMIDDTFLKVSGVSDLAAWQEESGHAGKVWK